MNTDTLKMIAEAQIAREYDRVIPGAFDKYAKPLSLLLAEGVLELVEQYESLREVARRMSDQVDELAEDRIERNARIKALEEQLEAVLDVHWRGEIDRALSNPKTKPKGTQPTLRTWKGYHDSP